MANKQISDLQARTFDGDSIIAHDVENTDPSTMAQNPYLTGSATGHAVADFIGNGEEYTTDLDTVDKHINGAINELHAINGFSYDAYDDTATYAVGDLCIYNNALYKCTTAITTAEAWNASHWTQTSIADEIGRIDSALPSVISGTVTASSGVTITNASLRKYGKVVSLAMTVSVSSPARWQTIASITSDFQPDGDNVYGVMSNTSSTTGVQIAHVNVYSNRVRLGNTLPDANASYSFCLTWILPNS